MTQISAFGSTAENEAIATSGVDGSTLRAEATASLPRLGFLGVGWIGRHRLEAIVDSGGATIGAVADRDFAVADRVASAHAGAVAVPSIKDLINLKLDGIVVATPTALHTEQAIALLESGTAVFCQKPLGRNVHEINQAIHAAHRANRLLGVDMSYRFVRGVKKIKQLTSAGAIGEIYAFDLLFHNAHGPDKTWYYDSQLSGGGCVIDLGIHLVDLALWILDFAPVRQVSSRLFVQGKPWRKNDRPLEDYAVARLDFYGGATANLACSWNLPAGKEAVIGMSLFGTKGGLAIHNIGGSYFDFRTERYHGTASEILDEAPDAWGGGAALAWLEQLAISSAHNAKIEQAQKVAEVIDAIYECA
ncbi:MAG: Gfo/Idh/MocA family protein [Candidatus Binatia bacterium]